MVDWFFCKGRTHDLRLKLKILLPPITIPWSQSECWRLEWAYTNNRQKKKKKGSFLLFKLFGIYWRTGRQGEQQPHSPASYSSFSQAQVLMAAVSVQGFCTNPSQIWHQNWKTRPFWWWNRCAVGLVLQCQRKLVIPACFSLVLIGSNLKN